MKAVIHSYETTKHVAGPKTLFGSLLIALLTTLSFAQPVDDAWCGRPGSELPDLWTETLLQVEALEEMPGASAWTNVPSRLSTFLRNAALLHRASVGQGNEAVEQARAAVRFFSAQQSRLIEAAKAHEVNAFTQVLAQVRSRLNTLEQTYPPKALLPLAKGAASPSSTTLTVSTKIAPVAVGTPVEVKFRLQDAQGRGMPSPRLVETHTRKLHALLVDPTLEDYHHEHPITAGPPGVFNFIFTPRKPGDYTMWLDVMPETTRRNEYPQTIIPGAQLSLAGPSRDTQLRSTNQGLRYELRLPPTVKRGHYINARLRVTDDKGRPCFDLEPFMGAFGHVVGIMDDRKTLLHVHSHGEPPREHERSGPEVPFRFLAAKSGHLKLFVQTQVNGQVRLATFSFPVE